MLSKVAKSILILIQFLEFTQWSTLQQNVDAPLTVEAFNGVFFSFIAAFIIYCIVSIVGMVAIVLVRDRNENEKT